LENAKVIWKLQMTFCISSKEDAGVQLINAGGNKYF